MKQSEKITAMQDCIHYGHNMRYNNHEWASCIFGALYQIELECKRCGFRETKEATKRQIRAIKTLNL